MAHSVTTYGIEESELKFLKTNQKSCKTHMDYGKRNEKQPESLFQTVKQQTTAMQILIEMRT